MVLPKWCQENPNIMKEGVGKVTKSGVSTKA